MAKIGVTGNRVIALDGLRGVASLVELFYHAMVSTPMGSRRMLLNDYDGAGMADWVLFRSPVRIFWAGPAAVVLFFVLSGFVLSLPWLAGRGPSYGRFLTARLCRIYLPYLVAVTIAGIAAHALGGYPLHGAGHWVNEESWTGSYSSATVPGVLLMLYNPSTDWIDSPTWSLVWEMRVSLLFPLLVVPVARWGIVGAAFTTMALSLVTAAGRAFMAGRPDLDLLLYHPEETGAFALYFLLGVTLARYRVTVAAKADLGRGLGGMAMFGLALVLFWTDWPVATGQLFAVGSALAIVAAISSAPPARWLRSGVIQWLGRISFSLYLTHVPAILVLEYLLHDRLSSGTIALTSVPFSLIIAELFWRAVESPSHAYGRRLSRRVLVPATE